MTLSINDVSSCFGVSSATVERWIRQGRIPAFAKDGVYTFRQKDIDKWAARQNIRLNRPDSQNESPNQGPPSLAQAMENGGVYRDIEGRDKDEILAACVEEMELIPADFKQDLLERLKEREQAMSTGVGNGIAIPHPREPLSYLTRSAVVTCFLKEPVDFNALDNQPVHVLFFLLSTSLTHHLPMLSALSGYMRNKRFLEFLKSRPSQGELIEKITSNN